MKPNGNNFWGRIEPEIGWLHTQLRRLRVRHDDIDDVLQEILIRVHDAWPRYDANRSLRSWLFGFAFRVSSDYRRKRDYRQPNASLEHDPLDPSSNSAEQQVQDGELRDVAVAALGVLPPERRAVFVMMEFEDFTAQEVADVLSVPVNTVYSRRRRARVEFEAAVSDLLAGKGEP